MNAEKTIKQISDELGVDKQKVYRFVLKNHITASNEVNQTKWYNEAAQNLIKSAFNHITASENQSGEAHQKNNEQLMFETLIKELETKNKQLDAKDQQIAEQQHSILELTVALKNTTESLKASQALHAGTIQKLLNADDSDTSKTEDFIENKKQKKSFFDRFKKAK